ncbi:MAG: Ig-like domain-containing protein [Rubripirellula sp.]
MKINLSIVSVAMIAALVSSSAGCTGRDSTLGQVTGVLKMDGKPVPNVSIEFMPTQGRPSLARTNAEGKFVAYYLPQQTGAVAGTHRLEYEFAQAGPDDVKFERPKRRGKKPTTELVMSPREIKVVAGKDNVFDINLVEQ